MSVLASLFMTGCSQEEITPNSENSGEANTSYISVNLMSSDITGTRALDGYEDGSSVENKVNKVRFYFFTTNGAAANVKPNGTNYVNYYDWEPKNGEQSNDPNTSDDIESKLKATIVINTKNGDKLPQKIAAILNPTDDLGAVSKSLSELKAITKDYVKNNLTTSGKFVMFNSVYGNENKTAEICAVPIEAKNLQKTPKDAQDNPVIIYVERSVAKVRVALGTEVSAAGNGKLALKDKNDAPLKIQGEQVYLKLDNWSLTADTDKGRLVKEIDLAWTTPWWNGNHRSFWAINAPDAKNQYHKYDEIGTGIGTALYTNENALNYTNNQNQTTELKRTKVILRGTLCKADGSPFTIVRHAGSHFADTYSETPAENLPELKKNIIAQMTTNGHYYYWGSPTNRTLISPDDLQIVVATQEEKEESQNNCYVYAQLTEAAKEKTWYSSTAADAAPITDAEKTINETLKNENIVNRALVWKAGMTYYYYEIIHHKTDEQDYNTATKGVVRNHIYDTNVTKIAGLGTPVYDPEQIIYPEKPDPNDHYIAAEINILSWRIVKNDYELEW